jgi:hypothetical protein
MGQLNLGRLVEKTLGLDKEGVGRLRTVEWGRQYLWECKWGGLSKEQAIPAPFDGWFPASDITVGSATISSHSFESFISTYSFPKGTQAETISLTFFDNVDHVLFNWVKSWIKEIVSPGKPTDDNPNADTDSSYTRTLDECVRLLNLTLLDPGRDPIKSLSYWVYPEGSLQFTGTSDSAPLQYTVTFNIVGEYGSEVDKLSKDDKLAQKLRRIGGRFI